MRKKLFILSLLFTLITFNAFASKAVTEWINITLEDGSPRQVTLRGDEFFSFYASNFGELVIKDGGKWRIASEIEQQIASRNMKYSGIMKAGEHINGTRPFPHVGNPKALVILVEYKDLKFTHTKDAIDKLFNSSEVNETDGMHSYSSLAQYMDDCSFGKYRPQFDVVGPYAVDSSYVYYGSNKNGRDARARTLVNEACAVADADVDFRQYDNDGDGYIDLVYIVYAGYGENAGAGEDYIWPKSGTVSGEYDGLQLYRYGMNNELAGKPDIQRFFDAEGKPYLAGIGVLAHEFCHTLGLPDFYPTVSWTDISKYDNQSMEMWDLMDDGENNYYGFFPTPLTAWERELFGWIEIDTLTEATDITLTPLTYGGKAYRIMNDNDDSKNEYYIIESLPSGKGTGWYRRMRGNGMLVTHVNYSFNAFTNFSSPNNIAGKPRMTVIAADGELKSSYNYKGTSGAEYYKQLAGDPFPGTSNIMFLNDYKAYTGEVDKPITDITQTGWDVSFRFMGGAANNIVVPKTGSKDSDACYNLAGQKVPAYYRGIVISKGRKIIR